MKEGFTAENLVQDQSHEEPTIEFAPENTYYDHAPELSLVEKKADMSYTYMGNKIKREKDIFKDQNGSEWVEIDKLPRRQMTVALLAQPFFNISTIVETPIAAGRATRFFSRLVPGGERLMRLASGMMGKNGTRFTSKILDLEKVAQKSRDEMIADYLVFESVFEQGKGDRNFNEKHNINKKGEGYALYDFESDIPVPFKHFAESKTRKWKSHSIRDGMSDFFTKVKLMLSAGFTDPKFRERGVPVSILKSTVSKLKEMKDFYSGEEGERFYRALLEKTKYEKEWQQDLQDRLKKAEKINPDSYNLYGNDGRLANMTKAEIDEMQDDDSYCDAHELALGMRAQIFYTSKILLDQLIENREAYASDGEEYEAVIAELWDVVHSGNEMFERELEGISHFDESEESSQ